MLNEFDWPESEFVFICRQFVFHDTPTHDKLNSDIAQV